MRVCVYACVYVFVCVCVCVFVTESFGYTAEFGTVL